MGTLGEIITTHLSKIPTEGGDVLHGIKKMKKLILDLEKHTFQILKKEKLKDGSCIRT